MRVQPQKTEAGSRCYTTPYGTKSSIGPGVGRRICGPNGQQLDLQKNSQGIYQLQDDPFSEYYLLKEKHEPDILRKRTPSLNALPCQRCLLWKISSKTHKNSGW